MGRNDIYIIIYIDMRNLYIMIYLATRVEKIHLTWRALSVHGGPWKSASAVEPVTRLTVASCNLHMGAAWI